MAVKTIAQLKALWISGYKPSQQDYIDLFDTLESYGSGSGSNGEVIGYEYGALGAIVSAGFGKGELTFTNGSNVFTGINYAFDFENDFNAANVNPFFYGEITVFLPDGTVRYVLLDVANSGTQGALTHVGDTYNGLGINNLSTTWDQPTGNYKWIPFPIGKLGNGNDFGTVINAYGGVNDAPMSIMTGDNNQVDSPATGSITGGKDNLNSAQYSLVTGEGNQAQNDSEVAVGTYNEPQAGGLSQRVFGVGIGTSTGARANAFSVYRDGSVRFHPVDLTLLDPAANRTGSVLLDLNDNILKVFNGSTWVPLSNVEGGITRTQDVNGGTETLTFTNGILTDHTLNT